MIRKTKIVCTIGPATGERKILRELIRAGMDDEIVEVSDGVMVARGDLGVEIPV